MILEDPFARIALLLALATVAATLALRLRQPTIVAFLLVGILVGPSVLGWVAPTGEVHLFAEIGIAVLLFVVGLKLDINLVRQLGTVALVAGAGQMALTVACGLGLALLLGFDFIASVYLAIALAFSSTIVIVKLLSDQREIDALHGRIAMGILILQDIAVVVAMIAIGSWTSDAESPWRTVALIAVKLAVGAAAIALLMRFVLPRLLAVLARSQELLLVFALAWGIALATLGEAFGFSKEVGAFVAGFALASTPFREAISTRLTSIRDFLLLFFFVNLGAQVDLSTIGDAVGPAIVLTVFVLLGKPLIVMAIMAGLGYRKRTNLLTGITLAQISEFSIIFIAMGGRLGQVDESTLGLITLVGLVTIPLSAILIINSDALFRALDPWLGLFERSKPGRELAFEARPDGGTTDALVFGLGRYGSRLLEELRKGGVNVTGVDFDPEAVRALRANGVDARFGDAEDPHLIATLPLDEARSVVCTLPSVEANRSLIDTLRRHGYRGPITVALHSDWEPHADELRAAGATDLLHPHRDAADHAGAFLRRKLAEHIRDAEHDERRATDVADGSDAPNPRPAA
ncbi:MAG TPA: cation:proton antiporter [Burkholderiaceae bacterium]|nr:cation:proton antiporter [Burkholderiaceae bacterium]